MIERLHEALDEAKHAISSQVGAPGVALVLGSGLGAYADTLEGSTKIPYSQIPHMPSSGVVGHPGNLVGGTRGGKHVLAMQGRAHLYEGHTAADIVFGVRLMAWCGAKTLIVTNAAGGIASELEPGDLMAITDQINLTGTTSLLGPNQDQLGPRFPDMTASFDSGLIETATSVAESQGFSLKRGVYIGTLGPAYDTPAEIRMFAALGADAVGMSTVLEVIAARHMGLKVLGVSCISNRAAGTGEGPLSHSEVTETASRVRSRFEGLLSGVLEAM